MFSARTTWDLGESTLARAVRERKAAGLELTDLTVSNPTLCGFDFNPAATLDGLTNPAAIVYDPDPRGLPSARQAVARYYGSHINPDSILLTTSTSEAYSFLFRLLLDPGDELLVPEPGYPLFDYLGGLSDVRVVNYPLFHDFGWWIDFAELERRIGPRTRAIVVVHPNNPTGHATTGPERERLQQLCAAHNLALIVDEVFLDYGLAGTIESFASPSPPNPCLTFVVSGLSKIAALPQMKVGWLLALGPPGPRAGALARIEVIADTFLSMNAPMQLALPGWLASRHRIQQQILDRVRSNLATLANLQAEVLPVEAGWCAVAKIARGHGPGLAERLVEEAGVAVHPGDFYGFSGHRTLILSLLLPQGQLQSGVEKLNEWMNIQR